MYQEVAFDPRCLSEFHYYGLLKERFGFESGRYVIAPVREWAKEAFKAAKASENLKPIRKKSITNFLNNLQRNKNQGYVILPTDRVHINAENWSDWCSKQVTHLAFNSVISETFADAIKYDDLIEGHAKWDLPPTIQINKTAAEISSQIGTLLRFGGDLLIVDQYFRLAANPVLVEIFKQLQCSHSINSITLVTSINTADPARVFNQEYTEIFEYIPKFSIVVAPAKYFHDRYVISDKGAIKSGHGFSEAIEQGAQADKLSIGLCGMLEATDTKGWVHRVIDEQKAEKIVLFNK
ncbi:hypothetical protein AB4140_06465 [Shewanella sp. 10N.286.51.B2]|uniref:hypothetical protein n=1 Tax=Shewanella sp. 10N.286.51.B2 TaxID=3229707 RepID=UPI00354B7727